MSKDEQIAEIVAHATVHAGDILVEIANKAMETAPAHFTSENLALAFLGATAKLLRAEYGELKTAYVLKQFADDINSVNVAKQMMKH